MSYLTWLLLVLYNFKFSIDEGLGLNSLLVVSGWLAKWIEYMTIKLSKAHASCDNLIEYFVFHLFALTS